MTEEGYREGRARSAPRAGSAGRCWSSSAHRRAGGDLAGARVRRSGARRRACPRRRHATASAPRATTSTTTPPPTPTPTHDQWRRPRAPSRGAASYALGTPLSRWQRSPAAGARRHRRRDPGRRAQARALRGGRDARAVRAQVVLHGTVAPLPDRDAQIAPQVAGRIVEVLVREGDRVTRGQPLARIEDAALADQAQAGGGAGGQGGAPRPTWRAPRATASRAWSTAASPRARSWTTRRRGSRPRRPARPRRAPPPASPQRQLERATVRSPLAGVVLKLFRKSGELVDGTPATPVLEVGDPTHLELVATATAADLVRVHAGDAVAVTLPALPGSRRARDRRRGVARRRPRHRARVDPRSRSTPAAGAAAAGRRDRRGAHRDRRRAPGDAGRPRRRCARRCGDEAEVVVCGADRRAHVVRVQRGARPARRPARWSRSARRRRRRRRGLGGRARRGRAGAGPRRRRSARAGAMSARWFER